MKKNNLIIAGALVGIMMISLVSAGWFSFTGNAVKKGELWSANYCTAENPCSFGGGDCDANKGAKNVVDSNKNNWRESDQCQTGWCRLNAGKDYGQNSGIDVCECRLGTEWDSTTSSCVGDIIRTDKEVRLDEKQQEKNVKKEEKEQKQIENKNTASPCQSSVCWYPLGKVVNNLYVGEIGRINVTDLNVSSKEITIKVDSNAPITFTEIDQEVALGNNVIIYRGLGAQEKRAKLEIRRVGTVSDTKYYTKAEVDKIIADLLTRIAALENAA